MMKDIQILKDKFLYYHSMRLLFQYPDRFMDFCRKAGLGFSLSQQTYSDMF